MLKILLKGHDYRYELSEFLKLFSSEFSFIEGSEVFDVSDKGEEVLINTLDIEEDEKQIVLSTHTLVQKDDQEVYSNTDKIIIDIDEMMSKFTKRDEKIGVEYDSEEKKFAKYKKRIDNNIRSLSKKIIQRSMFPYLKDRYDANVPWGILTGIRPVKLVHSFIDEGMSIEDIRTKMKEEYFLEEEKISLILEIALRERGFIYPTSEDKISLYLSIPFCPTKCLYCSFPSHPLKRFGNLRDEYVDTILKEAKGVSDIIKSQGKEIETLYIGGGTPTALEADHLDKLITGMFEMVDLSKIKEFTVEAGRPDTITREKLEVLKKHGVSRISINPQTMNEETLKRIGRNHSVEDIKECFYMARELGFDNINMDLILGLPGETPEMVENTMKEIVALDPECVTVHTLALKRASELKINMEEHKNALTDYQNMVKMIEISKEYMDKYLYNPYYMYRQKYMLGNLENIGYSKEGYECLYNMQIMEERQSNYAIGAGAVSKFVYLQENRIERVDDVKNVEVYLNRIDDMIEKKYKEVRKNANKGSKRN